MIHEGALTIREVTGADGLAWSELHTVAELARTCARLYICMVAGIRARGRARFNLRVVDGALLNSPAHVCARMGPMPIG